MVVWAKGGDPPKGFKNNTKFCRLACTDLLLCAAQPTVNSSLLRVAQRIVTEFREINQPPFIDGGRFNNIAIKEPTKGIKKFKKHLCLLTSQWQICQGLQTAAHTFARLVTCKRTAPKALRALADAISVST